MYPNLEKSDHCLKAANQSEINSILKWRHRDQCASSQTFPVCEDAILLSGCHVVCLMMSVEYAAISRPGLQCRLVSFFCHIC